MATVLLVDDRTANREALRSLLCDRGHRVLEASDGAEALALAHGEHLDLVVTEPLLPGVDGYELVRRLRADPNPDTARTPVVFSAPDPRSGPLLAAVDETLAVWEGARPTDASQVGDRMLGVAIAEALDDVEQRHDGRPAGVRSRPAPAPPGAGTSAGARPGGQSGGQSSNGAGQPLTPDAWLRVAERLDSVGRLAAEVGHDFNNLLSVILAYTNAIAETMTEEITHGRIDQAVGRTIVEDLSRVLRAGDRASNITRQLLAFARRDVVRPRILDVNTVLTEMRDLLARSLGDRVGVELVTEPALPPVFADEGHVRDVVLSLALDIRDTMTGGGLLLVQTAAITLPDTRPHARPDARSDGGERPAGGAAHSGDLPAGRYVRLTIARLDGAPAPRAGGPRSALGLTTVQDMVYRAGGALLAVDEPDRGFGVDVLLPVTEGEPEAAAALAEVRGGTETVLVADDDPDLRALVTRTLRRAGYHVLAAEDGAAALVLAQRFKAAIHLLLTDLVMPGMLGRELSERLVAFRPGLRVLYMSGHAPAIMNTPGLYAVSKPFSEADLLASVRRILDAESEM